MALIFLDGSDHNDTTWKYGDPGSWDFATGGRYGIGGIMRANANDSLRVDIPAASQNATLTVGFAYRHNTTFSTTLSIVRFLGDASGATQHVGFYWVADGAGFNKIQAYCGTSAGTLLGTSTSVSIVTNEWHYYEFKVLLSDTVGTIDIHRDGTSILSLTGLDTKNAGTATVFSAIGWQVANDVTVTALDDIYINNPTGAVNTGMSGELVIETLYPDGNGTYSDLLGSDGNSVNNYQLVNETTTSDANYVGSATPAQKDTYAMGALTRNDGTIVGLATNHRLAKTDAGAISARRVLISDATVNNGADIALTSSYAFTTEILEANPVSTDAWTIVDIDDLEVGIEVRA